MRRDGSGAALWTIQQAAEGPQQYGQAMDAAYNRTSGMLKSIQANSEANEEKQVQQEVASTLQKLGPDADEGTVISALAPSLGKTAKGAATLVEMHRARAKALSDAKATEAKEDRQDARSANRDKAMIDRMTLSQQGQSQLLDKRLSAQEQAAAERERAADERQAASLAQQGANQNAMNERFLATIGQQQKSLDATNQRFQQGQTNQLAAQDRTAKARAHEKLYEFIAKGQGAEAERWAQVNGLPFDEHDKQAAASAQGREQVGKLLSSGIARQFFDSPSYVPEDPPEVQDAKFGDFMKRNQAVMSGNAPPMPEQKEEQPAPQGPGFLSSIGSAVGSMFSGGQPAAPSAPAAAPAAAPAQPAQPSQPPAANPAPQQAAPAPAPAAGPQPGAVEDGYRFKGGNPSDQNNWEPVASTAPATDMAPAMDRGARPPSARVPVDQPRRSVGTSLAGRPILQNDDGTISTEQSITVQDPRLNGGKWTVIPSIWNGRRYRQNDAIEFAVESGQQFDGYDTLEESEPGAEARHLRLAKEIEDGHYWHGDIPQPAPNPRRASPAREPASDAAPAPGKVSGRASQATPELVEAAKRKFLGEQGGTNVQPKAKKNTLQSIGSEDTPPGFKMPPVVPAIFPEDIFYGTGNESFTKGGVAAYVPGTKEKIGGREVQEDFIANGDWGTPGSTLASYDLRKEENAKTGAANTKAMRDANKSALVGKGLDPRNTVHDERHPGEGGYFGLTAHGGTAKGGKMMVNQNSETTQTHEAVHNALEAFAKDPKLSAIERKILDDHKTNELIVRAVMEKFYPGEETKNRRKFEGENAPEMDEIKLGRQLLKVPYYAKLIDKLERKAAEEIAGRRMGPR